MFTDVSTCSIYASLQPSQFPTLAEFLSTPDRGDDAKLIPANHWRSALLTSAKVDQCGANGSHYHGTLPALNHQFLSQSETFTGQNRQRLLTRIWRYSVPHRTVFSYRKAIRTWNIYININIYKNYTGIHKIMFYSRALQGWLILCPVFVCVWNRNGEQWSK